MLKEEAHHQVKDQGLTHRIPGETKKHIAILRYHTLSVQHGIQVYFFVLDNQA